MVNVTISLNDYFDSMLFVKYSYGTVPNRVLDVLSDEELRAMDSWEAYDTTIEDILALQPGQSKAVYGVTDRYYIMRIQ